MRNIKARFPRRKSPPGWRKPPPWRSKSAAPAGLLFTGGETARAVCRALGCTRLWLGGEVEPGIPWSRMADGRFPGLRVVTKAGGFGGEESLVHAFHFFDE